MYLLRINHRDYSNCTFYKSISIRKFLARRTILFFANFIVVKITIIIVVIIEFYISKVLIHDLIE